jgi:hypothetical protein
MSLSVSASLASAQRAPYLDTHLPARERAHDLVGRMTLDEKAAQLEDWATAIPRLGIPDYQTWNEALHGVARAGYATVFPESAWRPPGIDDSRKHGRRDLTRRGPSTTSAARGQSTASSMG